MKKPYRFLHISDLHFGRIHDHVLSDLENFIRAQEQGLDLVILTGDLTQRARSHQFLNAKKFISQFKVPFFIVPGNHDVPLYNLFLRVFFPYSKFKAHMQNLAIDFFEDDAVAVFGLWTVDRFRVQEGAFDFSQIAQLEKKFSQVAKDKIKIIACHHPLETMQDEGIRRLIRLQPHFILWGHEHQSLARYHDLDKRTLPLLVASGTSVSSRTRKEANSFNLVHWNGDCVEVELWTHSEEPRGFQLTGTQRFACGKPLWTESRLDQDSASVPTK